MTISITKPTEKGNRDGNDYNCSWNCGEEGTSRRKKVLALRKKQLQNAFCMLLLTQSTPLIFMGMNSVIPNRANNNPLTVRIIKLHG